MANIRKKGDISRINDVTKDYYSFYVRLVGEDRENLERCIIKLERKLGITPSNPLMMKVLLKEYAKED
ncbi:hypothetical protein ACNHKD_13730 [Methylocystis sp. JAN1]|uniref:hypothetical protein n=1 Tax=Methylocystis sp. JAN1 TaxID=3397211 RepID=UPI003FA2B2C8